MHVRTLREPRTCTCMLTYTHMCHDTHHHTHRRQIRGAARLRPSDQRLSEHALRQDRRPYGSAGPDGGIGRGGVGGAEGVAAYRWQEWEFNGDRGERMPRPARSVMGSLHAYPTRSGFYVALARRTLLDAQV